MANKINSTGTITLGDTSDLYSVFNLAMNTTLTGDNYTADVLTLNSGSWVGLKTSSLADLRGAVFTNDGTGSITIANNSAGTGFNLILWPGDTNFITYSGSLSLYANVKEPGSASILKYGVIER